jgi:hypothetical protein
MLPKCIQLIYLTELNKNNYTYLLEYYIVGKEIYLDFEEVDRLWLGT